MQIKTVAFTERVTYHDACHLAHAQRITKAPRDLVKAVAGDNFVDLPESDVCCGSAGSYNLTEPEMAERLQQRKVQNILKTGAQIVVTSNPGCMLQIEAGLKKAGAQIRVQHIADFLAEHLPRRTSSWSGGVLLSPRSMAAPLPLPFLDNELLEFTARVWRNASFEPGGLAVVVSFDDLPHLVQAGDDRRAIVRHAQIDEFAHGPQQRSQFREQFRNALARFR